MATKIIAKAADKTTVAKVPVITKEVFLALPVVNRAILRLMEQDGEVVIKESAGQCKPGERKPSIPQSGGLL